MYLMIWHGRSCELDVLECHFGHVNVTKGQHDMLSHYPVQIVDTLPSGWMEIGIANLDTE